jgi:hypothetical protein
VPKQAAADLNTAFAVSAVGVRREFGAATADSTTALTADTVRRRTAVSALSTAVSVAASAERLRTAVSTMTVITQQSAQGGVIRDSNSVFNSAFTSDFNARKVVAPSAFLVTSGATLTVADILNIDPRLTYKITEETRTYVVSQETRTYII